MKLIPALRGCDMTLPDEVYENLGVPLGKPLLQMSDFNSLIALSQEHKAPVFALTDSQIGQTDVVLKRTKKSMHQFKDLYSEGADRIIKLTTHGQSN
jgi:hypothetical protein